MRFTFRRAMIRRVNTETYERRTRRRFGSCVTPKWQPAKDSPVATFPMSVFEARTDDQSVEIQKRFNQVTANPNRRTWRLDRPGTNSASLRGRGAFQSFARRRRICGLAAQPRSLIGRVARWDHLPAADKRLAACGMRRRAGRQVAGGCAETECCCPDSRTPVRSSVRTVRGSERRTFL